MNKTFKYLLLKLLLTTLILSTLYGNDSVLTKGEYISAKAHYNSGDFETSYIQFQKLFQEHSDHVYINYYLAMSGVNIGKKDEATAAFERVLIKKPDFHRARLEFAKLLYSIGFKNQAQQEFQKVLNSNIPNNVKENIKTYLLSLEEKLFSLEATLMIGLHYSDNVNNGLEDTEYNLPGLSNISVTGDEPQSDNGDVEYANFDFINKFKNSSFFLKNQFTAYNKNFNDYKTGDLKFYEYQPTLFYSNENSTYSLKLGLAKVIPGEFKNDEFKIYTISPKYITKILDTLILSTSYKYQKISFDEQISKDRNYTKDQVAFNIYYKMFYYGITFDKDKKEKGERTDIDRNIIESNIGYTFDLTHDFLFNTEYKYSFTDYKEEDILFSTTREDHNQQLSLSLAKVFNKNNIINITYTKIKNNSNQSAFDYKKDTANINYIRKFQW